MTTPKIKTVKPEGDDGPRYYVIPNDDGTERRVPGVTSILSMKDKPALVQWAASESASFAVRVLRDDKPFSTPTGIWNLGELAHEDPSAAYDLIRNARKAGNKTAVDKGNDAHDTIDRVAYLSLSELARAYGDAVTFESRGDVAGVHVTSSPFAAEPEVPLASWAIRSWMQFVKRFDVRVIDSEFTVYNDEPLYMGTADLLVEMDTPWLDDGIERGVVWLDTKTGKGVYPETALQLASYRWASSIVRERDEGVVIEDNHELGVGAAVFWPRVDADKSGNYYSLIEVRADYGDYSAFCALWDVFRWDSELKSKALGSAIVGTKTRKRPEIDWAA